MNDAAEGIIAIKDHMITNGLKSLESQREANAYNDQILEALQGIEKKKDKPAPEMKADFSWLGLAGSLVAGLVAGGVAFIATYVAEYIALWKKMVGKFKIFEKIGDFFRYLDEGWQAMKSRFINGFTKMVTSVKTFFSENAIIKSITGFFDEVVKATKTFFKIDDIIPDLKIIGQSLKEIFAGPLEKIGKIFKSGGGLFDDFMKMFSFLEPITNMFKALGRIIGKLAVPLQILMSVFDTVSGALDGWNKTEGTFMDKLFGAIKGGVTGLLNGLIGGLLDLLKDGTSWLLNLLGFENASKFLDSFSFEKIIEEGVGGFFDFVRGMIDYTKELFMSGVQLAKDLGGKILAIGDMAKDFLKSMLRGILPNPQSGMAASLAAKAIPDAIYEFAGLNKKTGEELATQTAENTQAKTEQATNQAQASQTPVIVSGGGGNSSSKTVSHTAVVSAKSTKFDNEDMWARGAII